MSKMLLGLFAVVTGFAFASMPNAQEKSVHVATLDWPPYTGNDLPLGGATTEVIRAAFERVAYKTDVDFRPWKRAIDMASKATDDVIAYFPGYHCKHQDGFIASNPVGSGPLGFAENIDAPIDWISIDSIGEQQLKIGTVLGYANTDDFDAKVGMGWIRAIPANDDTTNLKKLARQRIDAAVIDKLVLEYLKATEPSLLEFRDKLRFNSKPLDEKTLFLCFRDDETGRAMLAEFNDGLAQVDVNEIVDNYFATAFSQ